MTNTNAARLRIAALVLPVVLGLACVERDWSLCSPSDECKPGYICTDTWKCVLAPDGGTADAARDVSADTGGTFDRPVTAESGSDSSPNVGTPDASSDVASIDLPAPTQADSALSLPPDALPDAPADAALVVQGDAPLAVQADAPPAASADAAIVNLPPDAAARDTAPDAPPVDAPGSCSADKDCSPGAPLCLGNRCAKCTSDNDCAGRSGTPACAASGLCVACTTNQHCTGVAKTCDTTTNQCVGCVTRSDCADACQTCTNGVCTVVKTCVDNDACCATGCNANTDNDCKAVCNNGVVEPGETCDPVSSCESASQACVGDSATVRTRKGDTKACTFACQESVRQCGTADGYCPTGCLDPPDPDCPKSNGQTCSLASECSSGFCASGVCCNRACTGACEQCTAASGGQCSYKTGTVCNAASDCMDAAVCSGTSGACPARQPKSAGTFCGSVTCSGSTQSASTCDGAGNCGTRTDTNCSPFACVSGTGCKKSCATNADCVADSSIFCGKTGACQTDTACWRDLSTNLLWQVDAADPDHMQFNAATALCSDLTLCGFDDWVLPTIDDLRSIIRGCADMQTGGACGVTNSCLLDSCDTSCGGCPDSQCDQVPDLRGPCDAYWSSSTYPSHYYSPDYTTTRVRYVGFGGAAMLSCDPTDSEFVRCVRRWP